MVPVLIGGGLGLFLWARDGDWPALIMEPALEGVVVADAVVVLEVEVAEVGELEVGAGGAAAAAAAKLEVVDEAGELVDRLSALCLAPPAAIRSVMMVWLLLTSQLFGEVGGEVEVGEAEAELELATELQLPVLRDKSVGSFSLADADVGW